MSSRPPRAPSPERSLATPTAGARSPAPREVRALEGSLDGRAIRRRDFLNGVLVGASGLVGVAGCGGGAGGGPGAPTPRAFGGDEPTLCHRLRDGEAFALPPASGELYDCLVVGGGLAGLTVAHKLVKEGVTSLLVLDKDTTLGGYAKRGQDATGAWGQGSAYTVFPYNDGLYELYTDLGIMTGVDADDVPVLDPAVVIGEPANTALVGGQWVPDPWSAGIDLLPLSAEVRAGLAAFRDDMLAWYSYVGSDDRAAFDTPTDASTTDADVRALDGLSFVEYGAQKGWPAEVVDFYAPYCRSAFGCEPGELSAWAALNFFGSEFQPVLSRPGGNAHLADALAERVGASRLAPGRFVVRVVNEPASGEVHVSVLEGEALTTLRARAVVYAGPRYLARHVLPDLVTAGRDDTSDLEYAPYLVAAVHVSETPAGLGYDNWIQTPSFVTDVIVADWAGLDDPASAPLTRENTLSCYCPQLGPGKRAELSSTSFEDYEARVLEALEAALPGVRATVTGVDLYRWGHGMLRPRVGSVFAASRVASQAPLGRIFFASHDVDGLPAFENAVGAALRAAGEVLAALA